MSLGRTRGVASPGDRGCSGQCRARSCSGPAAGHVQRSARCGVSPGAGPDQGFGGQLGCADPESPSHRQPLAGLDTQGWQWLGPSHSDRRSGSRRRLPRRGPSARSCTSASWAWTARSAGPEGFPLRWPQRGWAGHRSWFLPGTRPRPRLSPVSVSFLPVTCEISCCVTRPSGAGEEPPRVVVEPAQLPDAAPVPDLRDVVGRDEGRLALEIAAAGGHHRFRTTWCRQDDAL